MQKRIGLYAWGGPGTIRLLQTKYHHPKIDTQSFLTMYDTPYLERVKTLFGVTDAWVTFSWGFSDTTEKEDRRFILERVENFRKQGIRTHAYVQGLNVVEKEFAGSDIFCRDARGNTLPYSKGRLFTCPNNPAAQKIILDRVAAACQEQFDGVYVDNILFGLPPLYVSKAFTSAFGCACHFCQEKFRTQFGYPLPLNGFDETSCADFLHFRRDTTTELIKRIFSLTAKNHKQLGINLYDPCLLQPEMYFGYSIESVLPYLSYLLVENHRHPSACRQGNIHLRSLIKKYTHLPTFVLAYKKELGRHEQLSALDIDRIFSESRQLGYAPCIKGTEFTTKKVWHALRLDALRAPKEIHWQPPSKIQKIKQKRSTRVGRGVVRQFQPYYAKTLHYIFEHEGLFNFILHSRFFRSQLRSQKNINEIS